MNAEEYRDAMQIINSLCCTGAWEAMHNAGFHAMMPAEETSEEDNLLQSLRIVDQLAEPQGSHASGRTLWDMQHTAAKGALNALARSGLVLPEPDWAKAKAECTAEQMKRTILRRHALLSKVRTIIAHNQQLSVRIPSVVEMW